MAGKPYLDIDMTKLYERLEIMQKIVGKENSQKLLYRTMNRTAGHVRAKLSPILQKDYYTTPTTIRQSIGKARTDGMSYCVIPIENTRNIIGGKDFPIDGAITKVLNTDNTRRKKAIAKGKKPRPSKLISQINVKILKKDMSTLPSIMPGAGRSSYGDQPPFLMPVKNKAGRTGKYIVMTRKGKAKLPIIRVVGIGVPQMPLNQSREEVMEDIANFAMDRLETEYWAMLKGYAK